MKISSLTIEMLNSELVKIPCVPYSTKMFDLATDGLRDFTVDGFLLRFSSVPFPTDCGISQVEIKPGLHVWVAESMKMKDLEALKAERFTQDGREARIAKSLAAELERNAD